MNLQIKKNILITGASGGIGAALALRYANSDSLLILIARNETKLTEIKEKCEHKGAHVISYIIDIRDSQTLQSSVEEIDKQHPLDLVICNAGVTSNIGENGEAESWDAICNVIDTNLYGVLATLNPLLTRMQQRKSGQIGIVSSLAAYHGMPITPAYCASKAAVKSYGEALRGWLADDGIKVNVICPGFVASEMSTQFPGDKPMMIPAAKAADIIYTGLHKNKARISFPFPLNLGMWFLSILPGRISDWFMRLFSYGGKRDGKRDGKHIKKQGAKR